MDEMRVLMAHMNEPRARSIKEYEALGGYRALKKAQKELSPEQLTDMVKNASLRGRGGAGFSTGMKWSFIPKEAPVRYLVCNCDESEPGTFKDRLIIERDPHQLIEGILLACHAICAKMAFIYCRGEYFLGLKTLAQAIDEAKAAGYLDNHQIILHPGAGAYIAGEETAQLNSLEGYRATPRLKPPFPAVVGLYGKPTIINNVETLCNVVHIVDRGVEWFLSIGTEKSKGTKIFQVSGQVKHPGCYEFPLGVPLRAVLERAGWMLPGRKFKACYPGGSSCSLLTEQDLNIKMDFESLADRKSALGTASIIVMDDSADMVKVAHRLMEFYQNESCGKCTPCREGTRWVTQILERILRGKGVNSDLKTIDDVCLQMEENSFCPLAVGAAPPVLSAIAHFREEFVNAIQKNPAHELSPEMAISYPYLKIGGKACQTR